MTPDTLARALEERFDTIRRGELLRLRKKVNGLPPAGQEVLDAATQAIVDALTARCVALAAMEPRTLAAVGELFGVEQATRAGDRDERQPFLLAAVITNP
jgi:glutamyl-tRNAGlu reductase-like protein